MHENLRTFGARCCNHQDRMLIGKLVDNLPEILSTNNLFCRRSNDNIITVNTGKMDENVAIWLLAEDKPGIPLVGQPAPGRHTHPRPQKGSFDPVEFCNILVRPIALRRLVARFKKSIDVQGHSECLLGARSSRTTIRSD
ncbi:MAG: hypothetical protein ACRDBL_06815 [Rhabdaerophilum sp.]